MTWLHRHNIHQTYSTSSTIKILTSLHHLSSVQNQFLQMLNIRLLLILSYCVSCLAVNDDIFDWWKEEDNILPDGEHVYFRHDRNKANVQTVREKSLPILNEPAPLHHTTITHTIKGEDSHARKKEYWKRRRLNIMYNVWIIFITFTKMKEYF